MGFNSAFKGLMGPDKSPFAVSKMVFIEFGAGSSSCVTFDMRACTCVCARARACICVCLCVVNVAKASLWLSRTSRNSQ